MVLNHVPYPHRLLAFDAAISVHMHHNIRILNLYANVTKAFLESF